jgi:GNAT superfamily N-acetyltransferase
VSSGEAAEARQVTIRNAKVGDMPSLRRVFRESSLSNAGDRPALLAHPEVLDLSDTAVREGRTRVAIAGNELVGFACIAEADDGIELEDLFVDPDWMRRGVGRELIRDIVRLVQDRGVGRVVVTASVHARAFYENVGFRPDGEVPTRFGPGLRMHLDIAT